MIRQLILLIVALILLLLAAEEGQIIQLIIVLPPQLVPYYEWLLSFPGWQQPENLTPDPNPTGLQACNITSQTGHNAAITP